MYGPECEVLDVVHTRELPPIVPERTSVHELDQYFIMTMECSGQEGQVIKNTTAQAFIEGRCSQSEAQFLRYPGDFVKHPLLTA